MIQGQDRQTQTEVHLINALIGTALGLLPHSHINRGKLVSASFVNSAAIKVNLNYYRMYKLNEDNI